MQIQITKLSHQGQGIGHTTKGKTIFVSKAIPGDTVEVEIQREKSNISEGIIQKIIKPSPDRIEPFCRYFNSCGGCDWQMVSYQTQLKYKESIFINIMKRIGGLANLPIQPIIGMTGDCPKFYRNKIRFAFKKDCGQIKFSRYNRQNPLADIVVDQCFLQSERSNKILTVISDWAESNKFTIYDNQTHDGFFKYVLIREGKLTGNLMLDITTTQGRLTAEMIKKLIDKLKRKKIISTVNRSRFSLYQMETIGRSNDRIKLSHLSGSQFITDKIDDRIFRISHDSFFQTNTKMAKVIYDTVLKYLEPSRRDTVWDLYCGAGAVGIYIAQFVDKVIGVESCHQAILDARENALNNHIANIDFISGRVENNIPNLTSDIPYSIIIDPPRAGLDQKTCRLIKKSLASKIIYVSCNPQTLARDLNDLTKDGKFYVQQIQPIDCFPQTHHIESVTLLTHATCIR